MPPLLEIKGLRKCFPGPRTHPWEARRPVVAIDNVDLVIERGETFALVGESGCGKSTIARCVLGLLQPDGGDIRFDGETLLGRLRDRRTRLYERIQMVFQDPYSSLNPRLTVGSTLIEPFKIQGKLGRKQAQEKVIALLDEVGLSADAATKYPHQFSGGQRQRISIARALALEPSLLVADEPVSALDVSVQAQILSLLTTLARTRALSLLFISHDLGVVRNLADRVAIMYLGRIVEQGPVDQVFERPLHPYTAALRDSTLPPDASARSRLNRIDGEMPSALDPPSGCPFHPRCPETKPVCKERAPSWTSPETARGVACYLHAETARSAPFFRPKGMTHVP